jgi:pyrroline-5-carboxylate reductase
MEKDTKLGIIGCGNMGEVIARGIIHSDLLNGSQIYLYDINKTKSDYLRDSLNANVTDSLETLVNSCNAILLAVKPQDIEDVLKGIWHLLDSSKLVISIAAGVTIERIKKHLKEETRVVRVMPNIAALTNQGISALCYDIYVDEDDKDFAKKIFKSIGYVVEIEEEYMDAITAISGSGPAYFFYLTEILEKSAIEMGIAKDKARLLAIRTAFGSASLLKDSGLDAISLRKRVTSKGGTTEAAFQIFQNRRLGEILQEGIRKAKERAKELSEGS